MTDITVVVDVYEPMELQRILEDHPDVDRVAIEPLDSADLIIAGVGFERKTWADYVNSIKDGRLENQTEKMKEFEASYVLVEGDMTGTDQLMYSDMPGESVRGHMASLTAREEYGVQGVVPCSTMALLADYAVRLARKHVEDPTSPYLPTGAVGNDEPPGKQMWGCLPGVGPELAEVLWREFGSPAWLWDDPSREESAFDALTNVEGIGQQKADRILSALRSWPEGSNVYPKEEEP